jgi:LmbE family N-acetylglucosaminyl deacetylase
VAGRPATDSLLAGGALVLSPHYDDETIGCGLLMAERARRGIPAAVAVATDGRGGWFSTSPRPAPDDIVEIRRREWHRALDVLAVPRGDRFELGFPDGELGNHESELMGQIADLLRRVRPAQVFVSRPGDPNADHRVLARAARHAVAQTYESDLGSSHGDAAGGSSPCRIGPRPQVFTYRVYPGEGMWPEGRPLQVTAVASIAQLARSVLRLIGRRPLLLRAPRALPTKVAAIGAYDSQRRLLDGELRYVWSKNIELYWPMDGCGPGDELPMNELDLTQPPTMPG